MPNLSPDPRPHASRGTGRDVVRLLDIREGPLLESEVHEAVADESAGGVTVFVGVVRDRDLERGVRALSYSAHPSAAQRLDDVARAVATRHQVLGLAAVHRVGELAVGDLAVVVGASAAHRGEAFAACRDLIDDLKDTVPIWKHQVFTDGTDEWVGTP